EATGILRSVQGEIFSHGRASGWQRVTTDSRRSAHCARRRDEKHSKSPSGDAVTKLKDEKKVKERTHILLEKHVQWLDHGAPTRRSVLITIIITDRRANQMIYHWMPEFCIIQL
uniref:Uncharacterized protein n=1 Tax=Anopheles atroparvus TaxID=41427 RepID=A0AAG5DIB4_ANOAO